MRQGLAPYCKVRKELLIMRIIHIAALIFLGAAGASCQDPEIIPYVPETREITLENAERPIVLTEQAEDKLVIFDMASKKTLWQWSAKAGGIPSADQSLFHLPDECKPVYGRSCMLVTASGGGVALIRISDRKPLFYAKPGGNPHSAEILPDGNIVTASSDGYILLYRFDPSRPFVENPSFRVEAEHAHNVVWDRKRECLWTLTRQKMVRYKYDPKNLTLTQQAVFTNPFGYDWGHDLVPVWGYDKFYCVFTGGICEFDIDSGTFTKAGFFQTVNVKSVSSGPEPFGVCLCVANNATDWWTSDVWASGGSKLFSNPAYKIYKSRWYIENPFSYGDGGMRLP